MKLRIVLILILGLGVGFFLHASFVAAQSSFLSSPAFHISELLPQPLISRDWGFWGNKDAPGLDIVGDIQWRFIPASNDTYEAPAAILTEAGNLSLKGSLDAQTLTTHGNATIQGTLSVQDLTVQTFQINGTFSPTTLTLGPNQEASLYVATDTSQKGSPAIIYNSQTGTWMLRNNQGYFSEITTESIDTVGGGGGGSGTVGPGTINTLAKFTAATILGDSTLTDDGANVNLTVSNIQTAATTRLTNAGALTNIASLNTHTIPAGTDTLVLLAAAQTLSNKTLSSTLTFTGAIATDIATDANNDLNIIPNGTGRVVLDL